MNPVTAAKIIVIDDEPKMTKLLKLVLQEALNCSVETFNDPVAAYQCLLKEKFDVISLDHRMPKLTGTGMLDLLRGSSGPNQETPVLIFTGFLEEAENAKNEALENVLFLEKPIDDDRYLKNIKIALQMRRSENQDKKKKAA